MLVKLTPGVNFINVKRTNFSYEHRFGSFYYVHVTHVTRKIRAFNVDEIDGWSGAAFTRIDP